MIEAVARGWSGSPGSRELLSLLEATVLAAVPEKRVRKDIETGLFPGARIVRMDDRRMCFRWADVFVFAAVYGNENLNSKMRKIVLEKIEKTNFRGYSFDYRSNTNHPNLEPIYVDKYFLIDPGRVCENVEPRVTLYAHGLTRIEEKAGVLGGEAVFKDTRISVYHVGKLHDKGESVRNILEDYPALREDDIHFSDLYYRAHPIPGRPRTRGGSGDVLGPG